MLLSFSGIILMQGSQAQD